MKHFPTVMAALLCVLLFRACMVEAQDIERCLVAEARPGPDYPAILEVLSHRSRSLEWAARHYCALFVARHPSARQLAIRQLPGGPSAHIYARHWRYAVEAVNEWSRGVRVRCPASHFGDRVTDARRARRMGWVEVDCGATQNLFWQVPVRVR